jgi:hypothetical protein
MPLRSPTVSNDKLSALNYNHHASILPLCTGLARRITTFLNDDSETPVLRAVQEKTKVALGVIDSALDRYRYLHPSASLAPSLMPVATPQRRRDLPRVPRQPRVPGPAQPTPVRPRKAGDTAPSGPADRVRRLARGLRPGRCLRQRVRCCVPAGPDALCLAEEGCV